MKLRTRLCTLLLGSVMAAAAERPNILFIFSDDHATEAISAYGGRLKDIAPTPNIDRLAKEGALIENSFCCNSICGPSRAAILTGMHSHRNGFMDNNNSVFDGTQTTFPGLMQKAGYQTAMIGKWHLHSLPQGFDFWEILPGQGMYYNPDMMQMPDGKRKRYQGHCNDVVTEQALKWLREGRDKDKPFVLMCQHKAPHRSWSPAPRHFKLFDGVTIPEPDTLFDDYKNRSKTLAENEMSIANHFSWGHDMKFHGENLFPKHFTAGYGFGDYKRMTEDQREAWDAHYEPLNQKFIADMKAGKLTDQDVTRWKYQRYMKNYLRCVKGVDEGVGKLLDYLDEAGLAENTIVIYSSDQGFYLGEHGWYDKRWMFEESLEMPFLIRWPGVIKPGSRPKAMIQNIDYGPTFLDVAGVEAPAHMQGKSIVPVLKSELSKPEDFREAIYYQYTGERTHHVAKHDGVRTQRYKIMRFPNTNEWNLFDLEKDPKEMQSFHDDTEYADVFARMKKLYFDVRAEYEVYDATVPASRMNQKWWKDRHNNAKKTAKAGGHEVLMIGDSITQGWEGAGKAAWAKYLAPRKAINLGFSGDRTQHVLWRLLMEEMPTDDAPKAAVIMIGTNNAKSNVDKPHETAVGIQHIVKLLRDRKPEMDVVLFGVFPRGATAEDKLRQHNIAVNKEIKEFASTDGKVHFVDISEQFLDEKGTLSKKVMPDLLHLNAGSYEIWGKALDAELKKLDL
ncbi:hypothetical protein Rhal01_01458 [Rubritalea halochordaticola]|uniref:DUF4976 domain-containing protein n=1 Tax=Rubritalea halochordaticola TaxID=714537 RepID=A0ABP9UYG0_9BACT